MTVNCQLFKKLANDICPINDVGKFDLSTLFGLMSFWQEMDKLEQIPGFKSKCSTMNRV